MNYEMKGQQLKVGEKIWRWRVGERFEKNNTHGLPLVKMEFVVLCGLYIDQNAGRVKASKRPDLFLHPLNRCCVLELVVDIFGPHKHGLVERKHSG